MRLPASAAIKIKAAVGACGLLVCLGLSAAGSRAPSGPGAAPTDANDPSAGGNHQPNAQAAAGLAALAYELLDAHLDTTQLVDPLPYDLSWAAHLDYLRALQRKGREILARTASEELSSCRWADLGSLNVR